MSEISRRDAVKAAAVGAAVLGTTSLAAQAKEEGKRGSTALSQRNTVFDKAQVGKLLQVARQHSKIRDWCQFGQPGIDGICGRLTVQPDRLPDFVRAALTLDELRPQLEIFPLGIPVIDEIAVNLRVGRT